MSDVAKVAKHHPDVGSRATRAIVAKQVALDNNEIMQSLRDEMATSMNEKGMFVLSFLLFTLTRHSYCSNSDAW